MVTAASRRWTRRGRAIGTAVAVLAGSVAWSAAPVAVPVASAAPPAPVFTGDVNTSPTGSEPSDLTVSGGKLFFVADDGIHGEELWVTDGTTPPVMVEDIDPTGGSFPRNLTDVDGTLWFRANNGTDGSELWRSDGTAGGTEMVADINPGSGSSSPNNFVAFDAVVHFTATDGTTGTELWRSDGTSPGTELVADLRAGSGSSQPADLVVVDYPPPVGERLWLTGETTSGSTTGERELLSIDGGGVVDPVNTELVDRAPRELVAIGDELYFVAEPVDGGPGFQTPTTLHRTVATAAGPPADFTTTSLTGTSPFNLIAVGSALFFVDQPPATGQELHRLVAGVSTLVADVNPGAADSNASSFVTDGTSLYFVATDGATGLELWRFDGASTARVADIEPGAGDSLPSELRIGPGGRLLFSAQTTAGGREPWAYSGTGAPFLIEDLNPGAGDSVPADFRFLAGGGVFFAATESTVGSEVMRWQNPFAVNTVAPFADLRTDTDSSFPFEAAAAGNRVVFTAFTPAVDTEPFVHDVGTGATTLLRDIAPGSLGSDVQELVSLGATVVFTADDTVNGQELWRTDGTTAGTVLVEDIWPGPDSSSVEDITNWGGIGYFRADDGVNGWELWRTDGTADGTFLLADVLAGPAGSGPRGFTAMGNHLYFVVDMPDGARLWRTDGTQVGTAEVDPVERPLEVEQLAATPSYLAFRANDPATGDIVMWRSDGTAAGTAKLQDTSAPYAAFPSGLTASGTKVYFFAERSVDGNNGFWVTDGTAGGTIEVRSGPFTEGEIEPVEGGGVFVTMSDPVNGFELWKSAGLPSNTAVFVDFVPGLESGAPANLLAMNGWVYMTAFTTSAGAELWRSDGATVERLTDLTPGLGDGVSAFAPLWAAADRVWFSGTDLTHGTEMWFVADVPPAPPAPAAPTATAGAGSAIVTWAAVGAPSYAPITGYTVTASPGGATCTTTATSCTVAGLTPATSYTFTVTAANRIGASPASPPSNAVSPNALPIVTVQPARLLETRIGEDLDTVDGLFQGIGRQAAGATVALTVTGRGGVPAGAGAVMLNVTAVVPGGAGFLTVYPCGEDQPNASSVNYQAGQVVPNAVLAKVGTGGQVCIFTTTAADLLVDVNGYVPAGGSPSTVSPGRLLDTRSGPGIATVDGQFLGVGRQSAGATLAVTVTDRGGVPAGASAVMVNVTAVAPDGPGFLTVFPCGADRPNASSVNYQGGQVVPNAVLAQVGTGGQICIFTTSATHLLVDVSGFVPAGSAPTPVVPARLLETRSGVGLDTVDGAFEGIGRRVAGSVLELKVTERGTVPAGAASVMVNVTAVVPDGPGFLTVFPCGQPQPLASSVNYQAGQVVPNAVLAKVGIGGAICVFTTSDTDLLVDVTGWT